MYRSASSSRVSDEFFSSVLKSVPAQSLVVGADDGQLPTYNPESRAAKKEKDQLRSAENAVHFIPLVLVLSAIMLWFFSSPELRER